MNLSHVLGVIFQYCGGSQLCAIAQVLIHWFIDWFMIYWFLIPGESVVELSLGDKQCAQRSQDSLDCSQVIYYSHRIWVKMLDVLLHDWFSFRKRDQENDGFTAPSRLGHASPRSFSHWVLAWLCCHLIHHPTIMFQYLYQLHSIIQSSSHPNLTGVWCSN